MVSGGDGLIPAVAAHGFVGPDLIEPLPLGLPTPFMEIEDRRGVTADLRLLERVRLEMDADEGEEMTSLAIAGPQNLVMPLRILPAQAFFTVEPGEAGDELRLEVLATVSERFPGLVDVQVFEKHSQWSMQDAPRGNDAEGKDAGPDQPSHVKNPRPWPWTGRQDDAL